MGIKNIARRVYYSILSLLPTKMVIYIEYFRRLKSIPNLKNPSKFSEKLQLFKLNNDMEKYNIYVDKYEARNYIEKTIGKKYLNNLIGVYDSINEINFKLLPNKFVLKCTHGSGYNIICRDKNEFNEKLAKKKINDWLREDFYKLTREPQYKLVKPRIICEEYLEDKSGQLMDYKFLCFNGQPKFIQVDIDRYKNHKENYYDTQWKKLEMKYYSRDNLLENINKEIAKPENFEEMLLLAKKLSLGFKFIRVDFYSVGNKTIFGELTFTPGSGFEMYLPEKVNYEMAELLD